MEKKWYRVADERFLKTLRAIGRLTRGKIGLTAGKKVGVAADELCSFLFASGLLTISRPDSFSFSLSLSNTKLDASWRRFPKLWTKILQRTRDNSQCVLHDNRERYAYGGIKRFAVSYNPLYKPLMMQCESGNGITR